MIEFRLLYSGQLLSSGNESNPGEKHAIRRIFHPQIRRLWSIKPSLRALAIHSSLGIYARAAAIQRASAIEIQPDPPHIEQLERERFDLAIKSIGKKWARAGYDIVPLVTSNLALQCSIDILLLRPHEKRFIFEQGDIDGQVRTLIDALRMPKKADETGHATPSEDENPLFCLLEDDRLISEIKVTSDQLLMLPEQRGNLNAHQEAIARINLMLDGSEGKWNVESDDRAALNTARQVLQVRGDVRPTDASVLIHVKLNHKEPRTFDNYFG